MKQTVLALAILLALPFSGKATNHPWLLSSDGLGPLRVGMSERQVGIILGVRIRPRPTDVEPADPKDCWEVNPADYRGLWLLFENQRLSSITISDDESEVLTVSSPQGRQRLSWNPTAIGTVTGIHVGDHEAKVRQLYGTRVKTATRAYEDEPSHELTVEDSNTGRGLVFLTSAAGVIDQMRSGGDAIHFMEGCE